MPTSADFRLWDERLDQIVELGAVRTFDRNFGTTGRSVRPVSVAEITADAFPLTRVPPLLGRPLFPSDEVPGAGDVVVLGYDLWTGALGGEPDVLGRRVTVGGVNAEVVGVMPEGFGFPRAAQAWIPLRLPIGAPGEGPTVEVFGRLAEGATTASAEAELAALQRNLSGAAIDNGAPRPSVKGLAARQAGFPVELAVAHVGILFLLLGVSANVATLMFARTAMRESEIVVRTALGASRIRIISQLFVETMVLALAAAAVGLVAAQGAFWFIERLTAEGGRVTRPFWQDGTLEPTTVAYAFGLAVVGSILVSLLPGLKATGPAIRSRLARVGASGADGELRFGGVWSAIIVFQVAVTVVALPAAIGGTGEIIRDLRMRAQFGGGPYVTFRAEVDRGGDPAELSDDARAVAIHRTLEQRLSEEPGVTGVTFGSALPGTNHPMHYMEVRRGGGTPERVRANRDGMVHSASVATDFFEIFDKPIVRGRGFGLGDVGAGTVVVNESLARNLGDDALGSQVRYAARGEGEPGPWLDVVGVVRNFDMEPTDRGEADFAFEAASPGAPEGHLVVVRVRDASVAGALTPRVREIAATVDPALRVYDARTFTEVIRDRERQLVALGTMAISVVTMAMLLSAAGLFALMAVAVDRRTREIGIRVALGADSTRVLRAVFARAAAQLGVGLVIGNLAIILLPVAFGGRLRLAEFVLPLAVISGLMVLVGLLASAVPARRALAIQPTEALKETG